MADPELQYDDSNRAFLQAFLARGTLTFAEARPILAAIFTVHEDQPVPPASITEEDFHSLVSAANSAVSPFDLSIRSTLSQHDRTRIFALVNTTSDPITQLATTHTADEISYIKRLLDAIFETNNTQRQEACAVQSIAAVRLHKNPAPAQSQSGGGAGAGEATQGAGRPGLTMMGAEKVLADLVAEGWLERSQAGFYSLAPRGLVELKHYLLSTYNGDAEEDEAERGKRVKLCVACKEIVTVGQRCPDRTCPCRLHNICSAGFFRTQRGEEDCPVCQTAWTGRDYVGEKAVTTTEAWLKGRRRSSGVSAGRGSQRRRSQMGQRPDDSS